MPTSTAPAGAAATDDEEHTLDTHGIAAPILQADDPIAALGVTLTGAEQQRVDHEALAAAITTHAGGLTMALGTTDP